MAPIKVLYIAGIYHSGSTLLDRSLSVVENAVGFGEISKSYYDGYEKYCSCGKKSSQCDFWGNEFSKEIYSHDDFYHRFYQKFKEQYGNSSVLIDSSKTSPFRILQGTTKRWQGLSYWTKNTEVEVTVIHLIRDPRSWTASLKRRDQRLNKTLRSKFFNKLFRGDFVRLLQWYISHKMISSFIASNNLDSIKISYESFCSNPEYTVNLIYGFASLQNSSINIVDLSKSKSHITVGNPSRHDLSLKNSIKYDTRWMEERLSLAFTIMHYCVHLYYLKLIKESK